MIPTAQTDWHMTALRMRNSRTESGMDIKKGRNVVQHQPVPKERYIGLFARYELQSSANMIYSKHDYTSYLNEIDDMWFCRKPCPARDFTSALTPKPH